MTRRLVVSHEGVAKTAQRYLVSHDNKSKPVQRALVVVGGKARQYWPFAASTNPDIVWDNTQEDVVDYKVLASQPALAVMDFISAGTYTYAKDPDDVTDVIAGPFDWLNVSVTAPDQYSFRANFVSGNNNLKQTADRLNVWMDAFLIENLIIFSRDLTNASWSDVGSPVVTFDQVGMEGEPNTASRLEDNDGAAFEGRSYTIPIPNDTNPVTVRVFILLDADVTRFPGVHLVLTGGTVIEIGLMINTTDGDFEVYVGSGDFTGEVDLSNDGLWWAVGLEMINNLSGNTSATLTIHPALGSILGATDVAATGVCVVGNSEMAEDRFFRTLSNQSPIFTSGSPAANTEHTFGCQQASQGNSPLQLDIMVAAIDPSSDQFIIPDTATIVTKRVTFDAIVTNTANDLAWSTDEWTAEENKIGSDADCELVIGSDGTAFVDGDDSGITGGNWHVDAPVVASPEDFGVTVTLVSGDAPTGPALATRHLLSSDREWLLISAFGDGNQTCELDVAVDDGVTTITRRVNMTSERTEGTPDEVVWTDTDRAVTGFSPLADSGDAVATVNMNTLGVGAGLFSPLGSGFSEDWHGGAPTAGNPGDYEVYLTVASGVAPDTGPAVDTWHQLESDRVWTLTADGQQVILLQGWWDVTVRLIGNASSAVTKRVGVQAVSETGQ